MYTLTPVNRNVKTINFIGGGTVFHIRPHFALASAVYGETARELHSLYIHTDDRKLDPCLYLTRIGGGFKEPPLETNADVEALIGKLKADPNTKIIFFSPAMCDFEGHVIADNGVAMGSGKDLLRLDSDRDYTLHLTPAKKVIKTIRDGRKDIFLVGFKTTTAATPEQMFEKGLKLLKSASCNLVLVNDVTLRTNIIVTPEEAVYHVTTNRLEVLKNLLEMALLRSHLTFTQSTVVDGERVAWTDWRVPASLRTVVDYCVAKNAYKPFAGSTVGHFAVKISDTEFLTSIRRSNFNDIGQNGLVYVKTDGPDTVLAYGAKPSVGGQSQRIVFKDHPGMDCIVHFHCPLKDHPRDHVPVRSQREYECGSHECGRNTSNGLAEFGNLKAVYLKQHGPNIVFSKNVNPQEVIDFIEANFDLDKKTNGPV